MRHIVKLMTAILFICIGLTSHSAETGDTTIVRSHQATDLTWYGTYEHRSEFPAKGNSYQKVVMSYTMGCASEGCSDWDYTTRVVAEKPTGRFDSTKKQWPSFKVNGQTKDSIMISLNPTYRTFFDSTNKVTDSFKSDSLRIVKFANQQAPTEPTDTVYAWPAGYYNQTFDTAGNVVDSHFVNADSTWQVSYKDYFEKFEVMKELTLAKAITPYGGYMYQGNKGYDNNWQHEMLFDVTDFQQFLSDSVNVKVFFEGWPERENAGFSATINFHFVEGKPVKPVKSIHQLYNGGFKYKNATDFEQNKMPPVNLDVPAGVEQAKVRVIASGHGFDNDKNCAEFCKKHYFLSVNGTEVARQLLWRDDCGMNPIYPQGGTWLLDRANWCPGTRVTIYEHDVSNQLQSGSNTVNIDMETIDWSGSQAPSYGFAVQLITYGDSDVTLDASLEDIIAPSAKDEHARYNPSIMEPKVKVKNTGKSTINSIQFTYAPVNAPDNKYTWNGNLESMQSKEITFPQKVKKQRQGDTVFNVRIEQVNGKNDDYNANNALTSHFDKPPVLPNEFRVWLSTNQQADQNTLTIKNASGEVFYERSNLSNNKTYKDTIRLPNKYGEYKLVLNDDAPSLEPPEDENGLYFPFIQQVGSGNLSIWEVEGFSSIQSFEQNFGTKIVYHFTTGTSFWSGRETFKSTSELKITPNPSDNQVKVHLPESFSHSGQPLKVIDQLGKVKFEQAIRSQNPVIDVKHYEPGVYFIRANGGQDVITKKLIVH